jgi:hypothetical protein
MVVCAHAEFSPIPFLLLIGVLFFFFLCFFHHNNIEVIDLARYYGL